MMIKSKGQYDVIVVGAGPAGSTASYLLAKDGLKVLLLDKKRFPRDKLCGGLLTRKTLKLLEDIYRTSADSLIADKVISDYSHSYGVKLWEKPFIRGKLAYPFHLVNRQRYDAFWLDRACQAGAEFRATEKVISFDPARNQVITASGGAFSAKLLMGADGAPGRLRRLLVAREMIKREEKTGLATAIETVISQEMAPALPEYPVVYFGPIRWGYAWCFPRNQHRIIGMCGLNEKSGRNVRQKFKQFLKVNQLSPDFIGKAKAYPLPYGNYLSTPGAGNLLLLGDAAGLADPLLGEGIYYAHKSAQLAARAAIQSFNNPHEALGIYKRLLTAQVISELKFARMGRQIIFSLPKRLAAVLLFYLLKVHYRRCEEVIQGQRSFRWFHHVRDYSR